MSNRSSSRLSLLLALATGCGVPLPSVTMVQPEGGQVVDALAPAPDASDDAALPDDASADAPRPPREAGVLPSDASGDAPRPPPLDGSLPGDGGLRPPDAMLPPRDAMAAPDAAVADAAPSTDASAVTPLLVGFSVHMENQPFTDAATFARYETNMRAYATLFARNGAHLTLEPRPAYVDVAIANHSTLLRDLEAQGHPSGLHAAMGNAPGLTLSSFTSAMATARRNLLSLVSSVQHVSGNCSGLDFVTASADAGFLFMTGGTAFCINAMPAATRPAPYTATCTDPLSCHVSYPTALPARIQPWRMRNGSDWLTDHADGRLVDLPSEGTLPCLEEEARSTSISACTFTSGDIDLALADMQAALRVVDPARVNAYHFVWSYGIDLDMALVQQFFDRLQPYVSSGQIVFRTAPQVYQAYTDWERTHR